MMFAAHGISGIAGRYVALPMESNATRRTGPKEYVPLTAESLLTFCQTRLRDLDEKIQLRMEQQKTSMRVQSAVSDLKQALAGNASLGCNADGFPKPLDQVTGDDKNAFDRGNAAFDAAIHEARQAGDNSLAESLERTKYLWNKGGDPIVTKDEMTGVNKSLDSELANMSSNNEIQMIELQSLISKRATALQLTTNMMNSMNESQKAIAGNIGH